MHSHVSDIHPTPGQYIARVQSLSPTVYPTHVSVDQNDYQLVLISSFQNLVSCCDVVDRLIPDTTLLSIGVESRVSLWRTHAIWLQAVPSPRVRDSAGPTRPAI